MPTINPFNPNSIVMPRLFAGRAQQVTDLCKKLAQVKNNMPAGFFIYGERGIGKTALVKLINYIATKKDEDLHNLNFISSYYAVESGQDIASVLQESINKLTDNMDKSLIEEIGSRLGKLFKNGKFEIGAFGASVVYENQEDGVKREISIKDQTVSILSNILKNLNLTQENKKDGILIIIDELHNLNNLSQAASIVRNIITTLDFDGFGQIAFILIGYPEDVKKFFSDDSSSRRTFDLIELGAMPDVDAMEILIKGFDTVSITYDKELLKQNISAAGGYPHSIQLVGHNLIETDKDNNIDKEDWDQAIFDTAYSLRSKEFSNMYSFNRPITNKDEILIYLSKSSEPQLRNDLSKNLKFNIYQYIPDLLKSGAIKEDSDKKLSLQSQLFKTAITIDQLVRVIQNRKIKKK